MAGRASSPAESRQTIALAQTACLCLGIGLLIWAVMPALIARAVSGKAPERPVLAVNGGMLLIGWIYIALQLLIGKRVRWAMWAGFVCSTLIAAATASVTLQVGPQFGGLFLLALSTTSGVGCWLSLSTPRGAQTGGSAAH